MKIGLIFLNCAAFLFVGGISQINGQMPAPTTGNGAKVGEKFFEMRERANELNRVRDELNKPEERKPEASFPKIKKDFERLQIVNTEKLQKNSAADSLNYNLIADASKEIKERAVKLRTSLFPADDSDLKTVKMPESLSPQDFIKIIIALDNAVYHFVNNPIFQNTKLVKPEDSQIAQKELNKIILYSRILETNAEKMNQ